MTVKIGDKIKLVGPGWEGYSYDVGIGSIVEITDLSGFLIVAGAAGTVGNSSDGLWTSADEEYQVELVGSAGGAPTYYDFPGGVQVRDISAHLTSFGGQALQYVARATRLDGNNKGEAVKDLRKAIDFIGWEIERLEAGDE